MSGIELNGGGLRLVLSPELGGSVSGLWLGATPVLRSAASDGPAGALDAACVALAPYCDRIGYRRLRWHGRDAMLRANVDGSPHALHGVAWQRPWQVVQQADGCAELHLVHGADADWPYDFELTQRVELQGAGLRLALSLRNTGSIAQPAGLGWSIGIPKRTRSRLHAELAQRWECDVSGLPTRRVAQPGLDADLAQLDLDRSFEGWGGPLRLRDETLSLRLTSSLRYLAVHARPDEDHYRVGPFSHVPNAVHMAEPLAHGLVDLAPGAVLEAWMTLDVGRVAAA